MSGLGIDFGSSEPVPVPELEPSKNTRRRAQVRQRSADQRKSGQTALRLPSAPLRENRSMTNVPPLCPNYVMQHPLPAKPQVELPAEDVQHASATLRAETPSETATPQGATTETLESRSLTTMPSPRLSSTVTTMAPDPRAPPFLPASLTEAFESLPPAPVHELPAKPLTTPMPPLERDERVQIEVFLENTLAVEGGCLHGCLRLRLPDHTDPATAMLLAQPRVRLIGYESLPHDDVRHIFYRHVSVIDGDRSVDGPSEPYVLHGSSALSQPDNMQSMLPCFASLPDAEGFYLGQCGQHVLPFTLQLPMGRGVKGTYCSAHAEVGYIVIASVRVKAFGEINSGVAHCYEKMALYPYLNPTAALASAGRPIIAHSAPAPVQLAAALHRETWVAGQRVYFDASVLNHCDAPLDVLRLRLVCTETVYRTCGMSPGVSLAASTTTRVVQDEMLTAASPHDRTHWWTGAPCGTPVHFAHSLLLPDHVLSIDRSRHVDVQYVLRIGVGADAAQLTEVDLPLRVVHYVSLDPPPPRRSLLGAGGLLGHALGHVPDQRQMMERVQSMEALRSPRTTLVPPPAAHPMPTARTAQHRRSLDFINSAIRSATARHTSPHTGASPAGLGIDIGSSTPAAPATLGNAASPATGLISTPQLSVPTFELTGTMPEVDVSLALGDETTDDVELVFDQHRDGANADVSRADVSTGTSLSHLLDAYVDESVRGSTPRPATPQRVVPSLSAPVTPPNHAMPLTPKRAATASTLPSGMSACASVPRLRTRSSFMFATSASPLKTKASEHSLNVQACVTPERTIRSARRVAHPP